MNVSHQVGMQATDNHILNEVLHVTTYAEADLVAQKMPGSSSTGGKYEKRHINRITLTHEEVDRNGKTLCAESSWGNVQCSTRSHKTDA